MIKIKITCEGSHKFPLNKLNILQAKKGYYQLKTLSDKNFNKLKNLIIKFGFSFPFHIWIDPEDKKIYTLDGTQRDTVLRWMFERPDEYKLPAKFPCTRIHAKDKKEAAQKILHASSSFGKFDNEGVKVFALVHDFELEDIKDEIELEAIDLSQFENNDRRETQNNISSENGELEISPELFERQDYLVIYFDNKFDWNVAHEKLGIKKVKCSEVKGKTLVQTGLSRVIPAERFLELIISDHEENDQ